MLDCLSDLAPPIRLATMTFVTARNALRTNTAESIAQLTGGEFFHFHDEKDLKAGLVEDLERCTELLCAEFPSNVADSRPARAASGTQGSSPAVAQVAK